MLQLGGNDRQSSFGSNHCYCPPLILPLGWYQVNARIGDYLGLKLWNSTSAKGGTIKDAADFTMLQTLDPSDGDGPIWELYPSVAAVASAYGDPDSKYASFLAKADDTYPAEPYFLWNQPLSDSGLATTSPSTSEKSGALGKFSYSLVGLVVVSLSLFCC